MQKEAEVGRVSLRTSGFGVGEIVPGVESSGSRLAARYATWDC